MSPFPRLRWMRGRLDEETGLARAWEWVGLDDAGEAIARVIRMKAPQRAGRRRVRAVAVDGDAKIVELRATPPDGGGWLACVGNRVVGRAALPLQAVRTVEAVLTGGD